MKCKCGWDLTIDKTMDKIWDCVDRDGDLDKNELKPILKAMLKEDKKILRSKIIEIMQFKKPTWCDEKVHTKVMIEEIKSVLG